MDGVTVIGVVCAPVMVPDFGLKSNQLGDAELTPVKVTGADVKFDTSNDCELTVPPDSARNTRPLGLTPGGTIAPAGTILRTIAIDMGGCLPSVGVSVTTP